MWVKICGWKLEVSLNKSKHGGRMTKKLWAPKDDLWAWNKDVFGNEGANKKRTLEELRS